jgi:hypothetical protein
VTTLADCDGAAADSAAGAVVDSPGSPPQLASRLAASSGTSRRAAARGDLNPESSGARSLSVPIVIGMGDLSSWLWAAPQTLLETLL